MSLETLHYEACPFVAISDAMVRLTSLADRLAQVDSSILITGESGVGKDRVARYLHARSPRASGPLVAVNCGAITETLFESELFGHVRGAFTGADRDHVGLFEAAQGGTLILDEVAEISPIMQVKLLRVLQERRVRPVGSSKETPIDVRVIASTNRMLEQDVAAGRFRKDLYYRLKVVGLHVPPLRERPEDILPLARLLLQRATMRISRPVQGLTDATADRLLKYGWPGNVRELENAMERGVALATGPKIGVDELPPEIRNTSLDTAWAARGVPTLEGTRVPTIEELERRHIQRVLELNDGNRSRTADQLGIGTATLYRRLKRYSSE